MNRLVPRGEEDSDPSIFDLWDELRDSFGALFSRGISEDDEPSATIDVEGVDVVDEQR